VVTWSNEKSLLSIYAVGTNTPIATSDALKQPPRNAVWAGSDLLVWTADQVALLRGDSGAMAWTVEVKSLPAAEIPEEQIEQARGGAREGPASGAMGDQQQGVVLGPNGVPLENNPQFLRMQRLQLARAAMERRQQRAQQNPDGGEHVEYVCPVGDRIVVGTSQARLAAIDLSDGGIAWQTRIGDAALDQVVSSDDFIAARFSDDYGTQIVALDSFTGVQAWRKAFPSDPGRSPINMALSPDGTLLYTLPDRICGKDLYDPGPTLRFGEQSMSEGNPVFADARKPDHLVVVEGQVLAVADNGQFVRVLSVEDGHQVRQPLSTYSQNWDVHLRVVGSRLYVINQKTAYGYSLLDPPDGDWGHEADDPRGTPSIQEVFLGKRHIVLLDKLSPRDVPGPAAPTRVRLLAFGRYPVGEPPHGESGRLDHDPYITDAAGIAEWQGVEGGFYYRSGDRQAHFLRGAEPAVRENPQ